MKLLLTNIQQPSVVVPSTNMHGTFASESQDGPVNYQDEIVQKAPREPKKKSNKFALLAIPVVVILCGVLYYSTKSAPSIESGEVLEILFSLFLIFLQRKPPLLCFSQTTR